MKNTASIDEEDQLIINIITELEELEPQDLENFLDLINNTPNEDNLYYKDF
jgi:hypothetical protein